MYAIVDIAGQQFKVEKDRRIFVHRLEGEEGAVVEFHKVLLIDNEGDVKVGSPVVEGASVTAQVLAHVKGDKVLIFKKKRRKSYQKLNGHRQSFTQILIQDINGSGSVAPKKAAAKKTTKKVSKATEENIVENQ
jgi:large subunit ribosomal protein L21